MEVKHVMAYNVKVTLIIRNDLAETWASENPILAKGELAAEIDTGLLKIGDGITNFNELKYINLYENNIIESISVNDVDLVVTNKKVNIDIPLIGLIKSTQYGNDGIIEISNVEINNKKITLDEIAFTGDVKNLKQSDTTLVLAQLMLQFNRRAII